MAVAKKIDFSKKLQVKAHFEKTQVRPSPMSNELVTGISIAKGSYLNTNNKNQSTYQAMASGGAPKT